MQVRDFSILLEPIQSSTTKKDISLVTGYNAYAQYIEHVLKTQKNELVTNMNFGSDYYSYIFGTNDVGVLEIKLAAYIQSAIPKLTNIRVLLSSKIETELTFQVFFSFYDGIKFQTDLSCFIEVPI
jgi:hypothetical protein